MGVATVNEMTQYLTCTLGDEMFALEIGKVREVLDSTSVTKVPRMPEFMRGVINLRGSVVPVVDLRIKFGMNRTELNVNSCIIITEATVDGMTTVMGALADSVQEVLDLEASQIEPVPNIGYKFQTEFIKGMGMKDEKFLIILDMDTVFSSDATSPVQIPETISRQMTN